MATSDPWGVNTAPASSGTLDPWKVSGPSPVANVQHAATHADRSITKLIGKALKPIGGALVYGHQHPLEAFQNVAGGSLRGSEAFLTGGDIPHALMHPGDAPKLTRALNEQTGIGALERGPLAGRDLPHKFARGAVDTGRDIAADAMTYVPGPDIFSIGKHLAPLVPDAVKLGGEALSRTPIGGLLHSEADLAGLTNKGKATFEAIQNRAMTAARDLADRESAVVRQFADQIRAGKMPTEVESLFRNAKNIPAAQKGLRPQAVIAALNTDRRSLQAQMMNSGLRDAGLIVKQTPTKASKLKPKITLQRPGEFFKDPTKIKETQAALGKVANPGPGGTKNSVMKAAQTLTHRGNQAFLANPVPHTLNLTNLAYNKYGLPTTVRGLANAARVSTGTVGKGKLAGDISELEQMGAKSQYRNIFDELGLTRLPGIPGLNRGGIPGTEGIANVLNKTAIIPLERASNYAQHKILNPVETGLRAAALNAERKGGTTGVEAARHIHQTFGTGRANKIVRDVAEFGTPFAQFHFQTAPASGLRTLATHPARVLNAVKSEQDMNRQINPGQSPQYRSSVPSLSTVRAMVDPLSYFANLGGLSELNSPFGTLEQLKKGNVAGVLGNAAGRFTPGSPELSAAYAMATKKKGRSGEKALNDLISALVGGYYVKK